MNLASFCTQTLSFPAKMDPLHVTLIKKLLSVNPAFRIGNLSGAVDDIIRDPFFASVDWNAIHNRQVGIVSVDVMCLDC